jgi:hypothetical protein
MTKASSSRRIGLRPVLLAIIALLAVGVILVSCLARAGNSGVYTTRQQLESQPEMRLFYPGSTVIMQIGGDLDRSLFARSPAFSGYKLGTDASQDEIFDFYRGRLPSMGWQYSPKDIVIGTGQGRGLAWRKGSLVFQVTMLRKGDAREPAAINSYATPYRIHIIADIPR